MNIMQRFITALTMLAIFLFLPPVSFGQVERHEIPLGAAVFRGPVDAPITIVEFLDFQ